VKNKTIKKLELQLKLCTVVIYTEDVTTTSGEINSWNNKKIVPTFKIFAVILT